MIQQNGQSINSSKVYCKFDTSYYYRQYRNVLIVAKCIVNYYGKAMDGITWFVLIVAKCIVNIYNF